MAPISVVLAVGAPLLHARVRSVLIADPGMALVHDAVSGVDAASRVEYLRPSIVLCDRQMLGDPDFAGMRLRKEGCPLVVLVTVNSGVPRAHSSLTISGAIPFDTCSGDMASRLRAILQVAAAAPQPASAQSARRLTASPMLVRLSGRFSVPETRPTFTAPVSMASMSPAEAPLSAPAYQPVPTKTAQLKRTSFLKSMLDESDPVYGREKASLVS